MLFFLLLCWLRSYSEYTIITNVGIFDDGDWRGFCLRWRKNEQKWQNSKKVTTGGSNSRARTPVSLWPILATVVVPPTPHIGGLLLWGIWSQANIATILLFTVAYDSRQVACPFWDGALGWFTCRSRFFFKLTLSMAPRGEGNLRSAKQGRRRSQIRIKSQRAWDFKLE